MPKFANQKLRLLYLNRLLHEQTDENHAMTVQQMIAKLEALGIKAERKTIYDDIEALRLFGVDIVCRKSKSVDYFVAQRAFELELLVDAVASAKFLTEKKAGKLIKKLEALSSAHEAKELHRQVHVSDRAQSSNEKIFYSTDIIHKAINQKLQITFKYFDLGMDKKIHYREGLRRVSPYGLLWNDGKYYLVAHYDKYEKISHFRVDKMDEVSITEQGIVPPPEKFSLKGYGDRLFSMFSGEQTTVTLRFDKSLIHAVFDKFGMGVAIKPADENSFIVSVEAEISPVFFAWVFQFGSLAKIVKPAFVQQKMQEQHRSMEEMYR